jgi:hypothetical protein
MMEGHMGVAHGAHMWKAHTPAEKAIFAAIVNRHTRAQKR